MKRIIIGAVALAALAVAIYAGIKIHHNNVVKALVNDSLKQVFSPGGGQGQATALSDLRKMGPDAMPAIIHALGQPGEVGEAAELSLLNNPNTKNFLPYLVRMLANENPKARRQAALLIAVNIRQQDLIALPSLIKGLNDTNELVRGFVAGALSKLGPPAKSAMPALTKALDDSSTEVRIKAASALIDIDSNQKETVIPILNEAMTNGTARNRYLAAYFLYKINPQNTEIIPVFISSLTNENPGVRQSARNALEKIDPAALKNANVQTDATTP